MFPSVFTPTCPAGAVRVHSRRPGGGRHEPRHLGDLRPPARVRVGPADAWGDRQNAHGQAVQGVTLLSGRILWKLLFFCPTKSLAFAADQPAAGEARGLQHRTAGRQRREKQSPSLDARYVGAAYTEKLGIVPSTAESKTSADKKRNSPNKQRVENFNSQALFCAVERSRVCLAVSEANSTGYINASYVTVRHQKKQNLFTLSAKY